MCLPATQAEAVSVGIDPGNRGLPLSTLSRRSFSFPPQQIFSFVQWPLKADSSVTEGALQNPLQQAAPGQAAGQAARSHI
ncbi:MAG: hypothetical protein PCALPYG88_5121 [uncultured Paraburkholderia sp.]|nr:MAG: hypothetical protein PCALPYG08_5239 [uncultured Paraburkholderia sp.]CAH2933568.1 MAG: hypothetical protein PCALPYG88_5121 [uncultured Paraburkholderia sp.]